MAMKQKHPTEQEMALAEVVTAQNKYEQAIQNFNHADPDFFEIANNELTVSKLQFEIAIAKLHKLCETTGEFPKVSPIKAIYYPNGY